METLTGGIPIHKSTDAERVSTGPYQLRKIAVCACAGNAGNVFPANAG